LVARTEPGKTASTKRWWGWVPPFAEVRAGWLSRFDNAKSFPHRSPAPELSTSIHGSHVQRGEVRDNRTCERSDASPAGDGAALQAPKPPPALSLNDKRGHITRSYTNPHACRRCRSLAPPNPHRSTGRPDDAHAGTAWPGRLESLIYVAQGRTSRSVASAPSAATKPWRS